LLLVENLIQDAKVAIVPNSPAGLPPVGPKGDYWRRRFDIPPHRTILLHAGGIAEYNCVLDLAKVAHTWPENWVLILHGFGEESYIDRVRKFADGQHVILSLETVAYEQLDYIIRSADIGIALYNSSSDKNIYCMGASSGKTFQYLRCGLPVIASELPGLRELLVDNACGVVVSGAQQVASAASVLLQRYRDYESNAQQCYAKHGNFEQHFQTVLDHLNSI
jgi:glycosyltransferase involved in cell wall biosynthesis